LSAYESFNYTYNNQGIRIEKVVSHATHKYFVNGTKTLLEELKTNNVKKYFKYKYFGDKLYGFNYNDIDYYYIRNIQGDITSIITKDGTEVARYTYDAWGNHVVNNLTEDNIGDINPFRYRGYYYDKETQLYYLNARYYDPEVGRFISQDNISYLAPETINGLNLYAYCGNNPVMYLDRAGHSWESFWSSVGNFFANVGKVIGGGLLAIAGAAFTIITLPIALIIPGGGFLTQIGFSTAMYGGFVAASVFDSQVKSDMQAIGWNPFNSSESAVLNSNSVSFYKGVPVFRTAPGSRSGSFLGIFLDSNEKDDAYGRDTVRHEWGHNIQQGIMGPARFALMIGLPSWQEWSNRSYYTRPWEIMADIFGNVHETRNHNKSDVSRGIWYTIISTMFGPFGYFFLIGEY
jgi:RHS repeat-associated protein